MRLWSLHPRHLDTRALVACWREGLLAYHVLQGKTKWYKNHPQLERFKSCEDPIASLEVYLHGVCDEADTREYNFDRTKLWPKKDTPKIPLTRGQLDYETGHLQKKVAIRSPKELFRLEWEIQIHPLFTLIDGDIESWEKL